MPHVTGALASEVTWSTLSVKQV